MFRTKRDVDRHVHDIFHKLKDESEKTLRCCKIADLYYLVSDFESAKRYLSRYMEIRQDAKAYKLMGKIHEALKQKEAALTQYKFSFELDVKQEDVLLKVCELMADADIEIDINQAKHWIDRAEKLFPHQKVVFQLKEKILLIERPSNNEDDLEKLITTELAVLKKDVHLRVKLLKHYMEKNKFDEAYEHATEIEVSNIHRDSLLWYQTLSELFLKCKSNKQANWSYWILYISSLERYAALSLKEQGSSVKKTNEAIQAVYNFDQLLFEAKSQSFLKNQSLTENIFMHMWGQLHFHMACLLLQNTKREQNNWTEAGRLCTPLLLSAMHVTPINATIFKDSLLDNSIKSQLQVWYREGSYRCSQTGHVLNEYSRGNQKILISNVEKFCTGAWREQVYQRIFTGKIFSKIKTSYFTNNNAVHPSLRLISHIEMGMYNEVAEEVWPSSLHHQIWPAIKSQPGPGLHPNLSSHLFPELQFSVYNINQTSPVTLCRLDIDAFLNATVLCATAVIEKQRQNNLYNPDKLPILPADLINPLCTKDQEKWWSSAYKMYHKESLDDIYDIRQNLQQNLQRGLEVIRCINNHGLHPIILVHLARIFNYRAKQLQKKSNESGNILALETRSELYWSAVIPLLERLQKNQSICSLNSKLFDYTGNDMNNMELTHAIEEGKLLLAHKLIRDNLYDQAIQALQSLKCPEASFEQGKIYKKLADEHISALPTENFNSYETNDHRILLIKARICFYLTLERLRSPGADPKHRLNAEIHTYIIAIDNELSKFEHDGYSDDDQNNYDDFSEESYSSAHNDEQPLTNNSLTAFNNSVLQTPMKTIQHVPKLASTPRKQNQDVLDQFGNRIEARPSPQRLDAQIRQLVHSIESLKEQNREQNKTIISKLDVLIKLTARKENKKLYAQKVGMNRNQDEELYGLYNEEEYRDFTNYSNTSLPAASNNRTSSGLASNLFPAPAPCHPYSPLIYPSPAANAAAALQGYYHGGPLSFPDPAANAAAAVAVAASQHITGLCPGNVYNTISSLYRNSLEQPLASMQQMTENVLHQSLFAQRLAGQLPTQQPLGQQLGSIHINESKFTGSVAIDEPNVTESINTIKNSANIPLPISSIPTPTSTAVPVPVLVAAPISTLAPAPASTSTLTPVSTSRKVPPINVVITTSDTLPTTVPSVQPTLSVTIPVQHRLGIVPPTTNQGLGSVPHDYQICMPSQPTILTTVNLPPLSTTITMTSPMSKPYLTNQENLSIVTTNLNNSGSDATGEDEEEDPIPDFAPIIPLPDEVPVTTGEEDEETLFSGRAKLFRFVDKEWKERGIGIVKLLRNVHGKVRLLMRREQVHKICANHMLRSDMEMSMMPNNDRAYVWVANDFADEEVKLEKLCIKFKTAEEASRFKENFDKAKNSLQSESNSSSSLETLMSKPAKDKITDKKVAEKIGGFSVPLVHKISDNKLNFCQKKSNEKIKPSPFASLSLSKLPDTTPSTNDRFTFGISPLAPNSMPKFSNDSSKLAVRCSNTNSSEMSSRDQYNTVNENSYLEDNEIILIEENVCLMQLALQDAHTWYIKGCGLLSIVRNKSTEEIRLLMTDKNSKLIIYNQFVPKSLDFHLQNCNLSWTIGSDKRKPESYTAKFDSNYEANLFHSKLISHHQKSSKSNSKPIKTEQKSLAEQFKLAAGSWECKLCYIRNNESAILCAACEGPSPNASKAVPVTTQVETKQLSQMFKMPGSWECMQCNVINDQTDEHCSACDFTNDLLVGSKPKLGTTKFPSNFEIPDTKAFTFGIPQNTLEAANKKSLSFNFGQSAKETEKVVPSSISIFGANKTDTIKTSGFIFGVQSPSSTVSGDNNEFFSFGSPGKSFDFQFQTKSSPVKSPERAETSDDDVVEEAEDVHFTPVIPLPDKVDIKTGEENEEVLYSHRAKLFKFDKDTKEWKERGLGDIKLLRHIETNKLRLLMRRDQVLKLCLNHAINPSLEITPKDDKTWMWSTGDYSEGEIEYMQVACRFKAPEIAKEFKQAIDEAFKTADFENPIDKTLESTNNASLEIQIVYELEVSEEEKVAALKLQLPKNFYAYKYKDDCPGCIGCLDSDKSYCETNKTKQQIELTKISVPTFESKSKDSLSTTISHFVFNNSLDKPISTKSITKSDSNLNMIFGTSTKPMFGDVTKSTDFVFGSQVSVNSQVNDLENLKICNPKTTAHTLTTSITTTTNIFNDFGSNIDPAKSLFGSISSSNTETSKNQTSSFGSLMFAGSGTKTTIANIDSTMLRQPKLTTVNAFTKLPNSNIFEGSSSIGSSASTITTVTTTTSTLGLTDSIFGQSTSSKSIFGGQITGTSLFGSISTENTTMSSSPFGTFGSGLFSTTATSMNSSTAHGFGSELSNQFSSKITSGNNVISSGNIFSSSTTKTNNIFNTKSGTDDSKKEDINFLPTENALSFSTLKAQSIENPGFKSDPNFTFDGAGSSVFGKKSVDNMITKKSETSPNFIKEKSKNDINEEEEDNETGDDHDPYFAPIIPLPDVIEVRTGEEDEEKLFCQRAKLYRFHSETKEWKERGVGEMKLLYHVNNKTYRLLMRREQVHKIVCNSPVMPNIEFAKIHTSENAWIWVSMNFVDSENPTVEKLAVKFKNAELAQEFISKVKKAQEELSRKETEGI